MFRLLAIIRLGSLGCSSSVAVSMLPAERQEYLCLFTNQQLLMDHLYRIENTADIGWTLAGLNHGRNFSSDHYYHCAQSWLVQHAGDLKSRIFALLDPYRIHSNMFRLDAADHMKIMLLCQEQQLPTEINSVPPTPPPSPQLERRSIEDVAVEFFGLCPQFTDQCVRNKHTGLVKIDNRIVSNETFFVLVRHYIATCTQLTASEKEDMLCNWRAVTQHVLLSHIKHDDLCKLPHRSP